MLVPDPGRPSLSRRGTLATLPRRAAWLTALAACLLAGCGYRLTNHVNALPPDVHVLAVPGFANRTRVPRLSQTISAAVVDELVRRTHYRIQPSIPGSDAILHGVVLSVQTTPVTFDPVNGHATTVAIELHLQVWLVDRLSGKDLYRNNDMVFHGQYEISTSAGTLFEEDTVAYRRMSQAIAATIVSGILEGF